MARPPIAARIPPAAPAQGRVSTVDRSCRTRWKVVARYERVQVTVSVTGVPLMVAVTVTVLVPGLRVTPVQVKIRSVLMRAPSEVPLSVAVTVPALEYTLTSVVAVVRDAHRRLVMYNVGVLA